MATKTRKARSPFQPPVEGAVGSIFVTRDETAPKRDADDHRHLDTRYVEFVNDEQTLAIVGSHRDYLLVAKMPGATVEQYASEGSYYLEDGYAEVRAKGVWFQVKDLGRNKTEARTWAERTLAGIQDVQRPLDVALDGKHAPALTIALQGFAEEMKRYSYREDEKRVSALRPLAEEAGVDPVLLALAVKEDRLVWSTPPVAPKQVMVVVYETATGNLSERLVDEIVLASREVEGLGRIVHEGSVAEYLLKRRQREQRQAVDTIVRLREEFLERLASVEKRVATLKAEVEKGQTPGYGFHDGLRLADDVERAQSAAARYGEAVRAADLPADYLAALCRNEFTDPEDSRWAAATTRRALEALSALNGMPLKDTDGYW